ncbi:DUF1697 domain-containing protein [soil metagenome]
MPTYVALLRAVNVGGRYYKMATLRDHLTESGLEDVETHIQTGNVRFRSSMRSATKVEKHVEDVLGEHCTFEVPSVIFTPSQLREVYGDAMRIEPPSFSKKGEQRRYVTFFKTGQIPSADVSRQIADWDEPGESAVVMGRAVHIWLNRPTMEAKFFGAFKKALAPGTNRDLKVVTKLDEMWGA